jgi:hypothetical protein
VAPSGSDSQSNTPPATGIHPEIPPLTIEEARRILSALEDVLSAGETILIGGQAVALWVSYFEPVLDDLDAGGVASKDLDFQGSKALLAQAAKLLGGEARIPSIDHITPMVGIVTFLDSDGHQRQLDVLDRPYGLQPADVADSAIPLEISRPDGTILRLSVMHPERCMESRLQNTDLPNKRTELAWRQLRASIACTRAFCGELLEAGRTRDVLKLNERIFYFAKDQRAARVALDRDIEVFDAVLDDERLPEKFRTIRLPQMREQIGALRRRERERRAG